MKDREKILDEITRRREDRLKILEERMKKLEEVYGPKPFDPGGFLYDENWEEALR